MAPSGSSQDYTIAALWMEGSLSFLEQLCLKSFVDAGHHVKLYHYGPLQNVPDGIELADANDIVLRSETLTHKRSGSPAPQADLFRYRMLAKCDHTIWADTDAYCMKRFETSNGHFYGWESDTHINMGVLGMPKDSDTLGELLEFTKDEYAIPVWYGDDYTRELEEARDAGNPVHISEQPWAVWGPHAFTHFLHKTGEAKYALPQDRLYPFTFKDRRMMLKRNFDITPYVTEDTYSVHLYGRRMRARLVEKEGGAPHPKSLLGQLLVKHDIDPTKAPLPMPHAAKQKQDLVQPLLASDRVGRGMKNLTDLADRFGSDKGSNKHRYTELYQMLFLPFRDRKINFLELGANTGGADVAAQIEEVPSIRMWLEFFSKATIHALNGADLSGFDHDRLNFAKCDMDQRGSVAQAAGALPSLDIVVDDAHTSHHQQNAFLELFPRLKSGGLYLIEDLRWQPREKEQPGITKTADLFQGYLSEAVFSHSDPEVQEQFNALRKDISGCFLFQAGFNKKRRDQVAVIHKR